MQVLKEPLFHFFLIGLVIFGVFSVTNEQAEAPEGAGNLVVIDERDVARLSAQFRDSWRRDPTDEEVAFMVESAVADEILVRKAYELGLDRGDGVIRNRLRQKMKFLTDSVAQATTPDDEALRAFYEERADSYANPPEIAFEQVYLGQSPDATLAESSLNALRDGGEPSEFGVPSMIPTSMPLVFPRAVDNTFGDSFFERINSLPTGTWSGPVPSGYGQHLVLVTEKLPSQPAPFETVRDDVLFEWRTETAQELSEAQITAFKSEFEIVTPDLPINPDPQ